MSCARIPLAFLGLLLLVGVFLRAGLTRALVDDLFSNDIPRPVQLRVWDWWSPASNEEYGQYFDAVEKTFEAQNPDIDRLGRELQVPQIGIRRQAAIALSRASYSQSVRLLENALANERDESIRLEIVRGLRHIVFQRFPGYPQALQALGKAADDALEKNQLVRLRASEALWEEILQAVSRTEGIELAYPTQRLVIDPNSE